MILFILLTLSLLRTGFSILFQNSGIKLSVEDQRPLQSTLPRSKLEFYAKNIPEIYKNCSTYEVVRRNSSAELLECLPEVCHSDCVCNHFGSSGICIKIIPERLDRCQCNYLDSEDDLDVPSHICHQVRKSFFGRSRNVELLGCNPICRTDCICNHGAKDGICANHYGRAYCRCLHYDD